MSLAATVYHAAESLLVPVIVAACALSVASRYAPRTRERIKAALAARLGGAGASGWRAGLARRLAPTAAQGCASGCDDGGCGTCESNTTSPARPAGEHVIQIVRKR
jgi:hypothetical protein